MKMIYRLLHAERGVALMSIMVAVFILTIVVAAMAIATMGETSLSFDQLRGQQAVGVAEAGAYRALAELRRRVTVDLDAKLRVSGVAGQDLQDMCSENSGRNRIEIISNFAYPGATTDWVESGGGPQRTATLDIGTTSSRIALTDSISGETIGDFYAQIMVRASAGLWSNTGTCTPGAPEQYTMWFDYAIFAVGRSGNATRTVCLRSPFADRCPKWLAGGSWQGSYDLSGYTGWPVLVEQASFSQWALMFNTGNVWLYTGTQIYGPVHTNARLQIAGDPVLHDVVTSVDPNMRFLNCFSPMQIPIPGGGGDPNPTLRTACDNTNWADPLTQTFQSTATGGVAPITAPSSANPSRTSVGLTPPAGVDATDLDVSNNTTNLPDGQASIPDGLYVMDQCGSPLCGGIYIKGDASQMNLALESGNQVMYISVPSAGDPAKTNLKVIVDPTTKQVQVRWGPGWANFQNYPAGTFNGVLYVNGAITSVYDLVQPGGLWGILHRNMRMTIATQGEMRVTDHLVYENPPAGPGHNPVNVLGLWSRTGNITVHGAVTPDNLYIDAAVLSPGGRFWVLDWDTLPLKGYIYFLGGTVQDTFGAWGGFNPDSGYARNMIYDWRLRSNVSPPFFPQTDVYTAVRIPNPHPAFASGDILYERPLWEEMVGL